MTEESLGRAVAVTALAPIAERLEDQREREAQDEREREEQLREERANAERKEQYDRVRIRKRGFTKFVASLLVGSGAVALPIGVVAIDINVLHVNSNHNFFLELLPLLCGIGLIGAVFAVLPACLSSAFEGFAEFLTGRQR